MKNVTIALLTLLSANLGFAQDAIQSRTDFARSSIQMSIADMRNFTGPGGIDEYKDLDAIMQKFTAQVEQTLKEYQTQYEIEVIKPVRLMIKDYNTVKAANYYKPDEKKALLDDIYTRASTIAGESSRKFQDKYMRKLLIHATQNSDILIATTNYSSYSKLEFSLVSTEGISWYDYKERLKKVLPSAMFLAVDSKDADIKNLTQYIQYKGCYSRGCQTLLSLALNKYIDLLIKLNSAFSFELDKDKKIVFPGSLNVLIFRNLKSTVDTGYLSFINTPMNFSLSTVEFDYIQDLLQVLNTSSSLQDCRTQIQPIKEAICSLGSQNCTSEYFKKMLALNIEESRMLDAQAQAEQDEIASIERLKTEIKALEATKVGASARKVRKIQDEINRLQSDLNYKIQIQPSFISQLKFNSLRDRQKCILE